MTDLNRLFKLTGTQDEAELLKYLEDQKVKEESLELELDTAKKDRTTARSQATKAEKKLEESSVKEKVLTKRVKGLEQSNSTLKTELGNQAAEIQEMKETINQRKKDLPSSKELRDKAKLIIKQEGVEKVFVSLKAQVFLSENQCKNVCGSKYKIATLVDEDKVQLSNPS